MAMYRKKPVVIEARRFVTDNDDGTCIYSLVGWIVSLGGKATSNGTDLFIETLEGTMKAGCGDWIIRGVNGEFYPCKNDIFEKTHEAVDDE